MNAHALDIKMFGRVGGEALPSPDDYARCMARISALEIQVLELKTELAQKTVLLAEASRACKSTHEALLRSEERFRRVREQA